MQSIPNSYSSVLIKYPTADSFFSIFTVLFSCHQYNFPQVLLWKSCSLKLSCCIGTPSNIFTKKKKLLTEICKFCYLLNSKLCYMSVLQIYHKTNMLFYYARNHLVMKYLSKKKQRCTWKSNLEVRMLN